LSKRAGTWAFDGETVVSEDKFLDDFDAPDREFMQGKAGETWTAPPPLRANHP
jgi:hypothetical protein